MAHRRHLAQATLAMLWVTAPLLRAQFVGPATHDNFRDTSVLKPAPQSPVAVIVFEDLGCPACARAHPIEIDATKKYHVPLLRHDFPLAAHVWTFDGAVDARYIQDKISPALADEFRSAVFTNQMLISSKEDLQQFTATWLKQHGHALPAAPDPTGALAKEVQADYDLGQRLRVEYTPTIVVVTDNNYQVIAGTRDGSNDAQQLFPVIAAALAQSRKAQPASAPRAAAAR